MGNDTKRRLAVAAAFLVLATAGSRVLGLVREVVMVAYFGLGDDMGAFTVANKIPNLVRTLLADTALSAAFIPVFSGLLEKKREREAWQVAYTVLSLATGILALVTVLGIAFAPQIVRLVAPGYTDPAVVNLTVHLMRVIFPTVTVLGIAGILMGILNSYNHFTLPALAPIAWNVVIIGVVLVFAPNPDSPSAFGEGFAALAWGLVAATLAEVALQIPAVWRRRWRPGRRALSAIPSPRAECLWPRATPAA